MHRQMPCDMHVHVGMHVMYMLQISLSSNPKLCCRDVCTLSSYAYACYLFWLAAYIHVSPEMHGRGFMIGYVLRVPFVFLHLGKRRLINRAIECWTAFV